MKINYDSGEVKMYDFDAHESYMVARKLEYEGIAFYESLREKVKEDEALAVLNELIEEERAHMLRFDEEARRIERATHREVDDDHLLNMVDTGVFTSLLRIGNGDPKDRETLLKLGVMAETRSIAFYREILENTSDEEGRRTLKAIIAEEHKHKERLERLTKH